ncbi:MAG: FmdE family protein [Sulfurimonas sp.]|uniref:FmdE family protein n=1 Tax=Sulfurimonas sp. TaxID=2022749 RepID=UPI00262DF859|nr:FmdE family protein [Sulfurimonas sp.]MDD2651566.1 FmdE family protein [Sulfurimonas sp.]MDD3451377.1 FmdE family protein [Sulfurimonas sp.]
MSYPKFFDSVESIKLVDPLSNVLGAFEDGLYEITFLEVVKAAGHSCPTVAGAYLITLEGLKALYPDTRAVRGEIKVEFRDPMEEGVAGVIGNVVSQITGATEKSGFKGLGGRFARHSLMKFNANINSSIRLTRADNGKSVDVYYDPSSIGGSPKMQMLMQKMMGGMASKEEAKEFGALWQDRVERIMANIPSVIRVVKN